MSYLVLARKYRPQSFDDFVGQNPIATTLRNAIVLNRVAHAYLFCGPRGVGKTSMARVLAKALNCEKGPTPDPCNKCEICSSIASGNDTDVIEIDGASNRSIDAVREIRENVQYAALRSRHKIYIIDEVHMLTREAFNALLKTLEEPPPHVKFIFATTAPTALPETIRSRCQRFDFRRISPLDIAEALKAICEKEKIKASEEALLAIGRHARGAMRDALSLLDQLASFHTDGLTPQAVDAMMGAASEEEIARLVDCFARRDPAGAIRAANELLAQGKDVGDLLGQLGAHLRDLLVASYCGPDPQLLNQTPDGAKSLAERSKAFPPDNLLYMLHVLSEARRQARDSSQERIILEMVLVKLCRMEAMTALDELVERLETLERSGAPGCGANYSEARSSSRAPASGEKEATPAESFAREEATAPVPPEDVPIAKSSGASATSSSSPPPDLWERVVSRVRDSKMFLGLHLAAARLMQFDETEAVIALASGNSRLENELMEPENRKLIEAALAAEIGHSVRFRVVKDARPHAPEPQPRTVAPSAPPEIQDEMVRKALEMLDGRIVHEERF